MLTKIEFYVRGLAIAAATACVLSVGAEPITIANAGFESRAAEFVDGARVYVQPGLDSWRHFEADNNGGPVYLWDPGEPGTAGLPGFGGNAPEGQIVVRIQTRYNDDEFNRIRDFEAAAQMLTETFDPATNYVLRALVGRIDGLLWNGYALQLVAGGRNGDPGLGRYKPWVEGGTVVAEDTNSLQVAEGTFVTSTVVYAANEAFAHLAGLPLQIRLCALEDPLNHATTSYAAYDDVKLETAAEPPSPPRPPGMVLLVR